MTTRQMITRIDFTVAGEQVVVNKITEAVLPNNRDVVIDSSIKELTALDEMLAWCEQHGWTVRRFMPLGARAWKGTEPRPVRHKAGILKMVRQLQRQGINTNRLDLRYDM